MTSTSAFVFETLQQIRDHSRLFVEQAHRDQNWEAEENYSIIYAMASTAIRAVETTESKALDCGAPSSEGAFHFETEQTRGSDQVLRLVERCPELLRE